MPATVSLRDGVRIWETETVKREMGKSQRKEQTFKN